MSILPDLASMQIVVTAATSSASAALGNLTGDLNKVGYAVKQAAEGFAGIDYVQKKISQTGMYLTTRLTLPLGVAGLASVYFASKMEQAQVSMETFLGSKAKADAFIASMKNLADITPFTFGEIQKATTKLLAFGFAAEETSAMITTIGDAASALSLGAEGIDRVTRALGQIKAKGKLQAEEMMQITEAGLGGWQMLADQMGITTAEVMALTTQGAIDSTTAITALLAGMNAQFGGMMKVQSQTLSGLLSTMRDKTEQIWVKLGNVFLPFLKILVKIGTAIISLIAKAPQWAYVLVAIPLAGAAALGPLILGLLAVAKAYLLIKSISFGLKLATGTMELAKSAGIADKAIAALGTNAGRNFASIFNAIKNPKAAIQSLVTVISVAADSLRMFLQRGKIASEGMRGLLGATPVAKRVSGGFEIATDLSNMAARRAEIALTLESASASGADAAAKTANASAAGTAAASNGILALSLKAVGHAAWKATLAMLKFVASLLLNPWTWVIAGIVGVLLVMKHFDDEAKKKRDLKISVIVEGVDYVKQRLNDVISTYGFWSSEAKKARDSAIKAAEEGIRATQQAEQEYRRRSYGGRGGGSAPGANPDAIPPGKMRESIKIVEDYKKAITELHRLQNMGPLTGRDLKTQEELRAELVRGAGETLAQFKARQDAITKTRRDFMADQLRIAKEAAAKMYGVNSQAYKDALKAEEDFNNEMLKKSEELAQQLLQSRKDYLVGVATGDSTFGNALGQINALGEMTGDIPDQNIWLGSIEAAGKAAKKAFLVGLATGDSAYGTMIGQINEKGQMVGDDPANNIYKGTILAAQRAKLGAATTVQQAALDAADLAKKLAEIPKNINQILTQDWATVGKNLHEAMLQLFTGFGTDAANLQALIDQQAITNAIMSIIQALGTILTVMKDMPKKAITPTKQAWQSFGQMMYQAMLDILEGFKSIDLGMLKINESTIGSIANIASSLGAILTTIKDMPKKHLKTIEQNWRMLGVYLLRGMNEILKVFSGNAEGLVKQSEKMGSVGSIAGGLGSFIQALADMPKKFVKITPQSWYTLGFAVADMMDAVLWVFELISTKTLEKNATRLESIGNMASSISSMVTSFVDITSSSVKKALAGINAIRNNATKLGTGITKMVTEFIRIFTGSEIKISEKSSSNYSRIFDMVGNISDMISTFAEITAAKVEKALAGLRVVAKKTPVLAKSMISVAKSLQDALKSMKVNETSSNKMSYVTDATSSIANIISTFAEITKRMIEKAVISIKLVTAATPSLGKAMFEMVTALRSEIESLLGDDEGTGFGLFADLADKVVNIVSNVANIITTYLDMTEYKINKAIEGLQLTGSRGKDIGGAMAEMIKQFAVGIGKADVPDSLVTITGKLVGIAQDVGSVLTDFAALTLSGIQTAIANLDTVARNAPQIAGALMRMASAIKAAFDKAGVNEEFAETTDAIGRVMDTVSSVFSFATSMTEENVAILTKFAADSGKLTGLWQGVGSALTTMINGLVSSLHIIPDATKLAEAEKAISALAAIFSSLAGLMDSVSAASSWTAAHPQTTGATQTPAPAAQTAKALIDSLGGAAKPYVPPVAVPTSRGGGIAKVQVDVSWQTLTGEPSEREKRQFVRCLQPEFERIAGMRLRTAF